MNQQDMTHLAAAIGRLQTHDHLCLVYDTPPDGFLKPEQASLRVERLLGNIVEREQAEADLHERTSALEKKNALLETLLKGLLGQEVRMAELKEKLRKLERRSAN
jgi:hypothetical protein